jgi:hypothetical protein
MTTEIPFYTKDGWLTSYGFACGYIEKIKFLGQVGEMYLEHGVYTVSWFDHLHEKSIYFFQTEKLTDARREYKRIKKEIESLCSNPLLLKEIEEAIRLNQEHKA